MLGRPTSLDTLLGTRCAVVCTIMNYEKRTKGKKYTEYERLSYMAETCDAKGKNGVTESGGGHPLRSSLVKGLSFNSDGVVFAA